MKVIIIGPAYPWRGGLATFNERMARELIDTGYEVVMYTFSLQYPAFLFPGKTQYSDSKPPKDLVIHSCINSINPISWIKTAKKIQKENADILIVRYWMPFMAPCLGSILRIIGKKKNKVRIALVDNALPHEKRPGDSLLTRFFVTSSDKFVTMSKKVASDLALFTSEAATVIPHPLYDNFGDKRNALEARKKLHIPDDAYVYLFFGFIRQYKGLDLLVQAFTQFIQTNNHRKRCILLIAGEFYSGEEEIKSMIAQSTAAGSIFLHDKFISDEDVAYYFSAADCVVQPYRSATQSGVTPLAYHFEVPMIVTDVGALADMVPPGIGLVCQPNEASLSMALAQMHAFDLDTFTKIIREEKKKYSWNSFIHAILSLAEKSKQNG